MTHGPSSRVLVVQGQDDVTIVVRDEPAGRLKRAAGFLLLAVQVLAGVAVIVFQLFCEPLFFTRVLLVLTLAVALGFLFIAVASLGATLVGRVTITVTPEFMTVVRDVGVFRRTRRFAREQISNVRWRETRVSRKGGSFLRRVLAADVAGRTVELSNQLSYAEANYLESELRSAIERFGGAPAG